MLKNFIIESSSCVHVVALVKFEHSDWGTRYKTLVFDNDQWDNDELIEYTNKERVNGENATIIIKVFNLNENKLISEMEIEV